MPTETPLSAAALDAEIQRTVPPPDSTVIGRAAAEAVIKIADDDTHPDQTQAQLERDIYYRRAMVREASTALSRRTIQVQLRGFRGSTQKHHMPASLAQPNKTDSGINTGTYNYQEIGQLPLPLLYETYNRFEINRNALDHDMAGIQRTIQLVEKWAMHGATNGNEAAILEGYATLEEFLAAAP